MTLSRKFLRFTLLVLFSVLCGTIGVLSARGETPGSTRGPAPITPEMERKVDAMLHKLTLQQKIALIGGVDSMYIRAEPSIGLPRLKMSDGPMGVRTWGPSTAYAAGINLAATWDTRLAQQIGVGLGQDARARGVNFLLGPGVDIYRMPMNGRNFEYFGEDPYLSSQIAVGYIDGVQSQGVSATVKHFALNDAEYDRHNENSIADERTMREIDLPPFEAAVKQAHVGAVMDSYNLVNGVHSTQNKFLNIDVLRKDWGFRGIVMSDWSATYDGVAAANSGLDLEMPSADRMNAATLLPAIHDGKVSEATIDQKVRRILRTAMQFGFFDRDQLDPSVPLYNQEGNATTLQAAEEGAVLLKNQGGLLPLQRKSLHAIAVIGPDAYPAVPGAGGSSHTDAFAPVSLMTGLSNAVYPQIKVTWSRGLPPIAEIFSKTRWCRDAACTQPGLERQEYSVATNQLIRSSVDQKLNDASGPEWGKPNPTPERIVWSGYYMPTTSGSYRFVTHAGGSARYQLSVDGKQVLKVDQKEGGGAQSAFITLTAGHAVKVEYTYFPAWTRSMTQLGVLPESQLVDAEAIRLAKMADVVVLSVGFGPETESEGFDRTYALPFGQQELIEKIASANPRTIVVLTSGGSVATEGWIDIVPALLQTWYAGQQAGNALPKILFGDVNPSGKLPISWEKSLQDDPAYKNYYEKPGSTDVQYAEGIFLGYRYFQTSRVKPLFPFGFGLSYTSFRFSNLSVSPASASPSGPIHVSFDVTNTGSRAGAEVAQIYVGDPSATVPQPKMELKGFSRVQLAPGKTEQVTATLDRRSLAYWDVQSHGWKVDPGKFVVYVGDSSENVPLRKSFAVR